MTTVDIARQLAAYMAYRADRDEAMPASPTRRLKRNWFNVPHRERYVRADQLPAFYAAVRGLAACRT
jgi:hypothetical protein